MSSDSEEDSSGSGYWSERGLRALRKLFETDCTFEEALELMDRASNAPYYDRSAKAQCTINTGIDNHGCYEIQFSWKRPVAAPGSGYESVLGRPNGLPPIICRDGMRYWVSDTNPHRGKPIAKQHGIDGEVIQIAQHD